jgi:hypothetical protein
MTITPGQRERAPTAELTQGGNLLPTPPASLKSGGVPVKTSEPAVRQGGASEPKIVNVELWPDADFKAAMADLGKFGHIENQNEYTKRLDIALPSADVIQKLADRKYVRFIGPTKRAIIHNTHVRKNMSTNIVGPRCSGGMLPKITHRSAAARASARRVIRPTSTCRLRMPPYD